MPRKLLRLLLATILVTGILPAAGAVDLEADTIAITDLDQPVVDKTTDTDCTRSYQCQKHLLVVGQRR